MATESDVRGLPERVLRRFRVATCAWPGTRPFDGALMLRLPAMASAPPLFWSAPKASDRPQVQDGSLGIRLHLLRSNAGILQPTDRNVQALATHYVREIRRVQPDGPYLLGGYCSGGRLAFEIARQLTQLGGKVALLALVELDLTQSDKQLSMGRAFFRMVQRSRYHAARLAALPSGRWLAYAAALMVRCMRRIVHRTGVWGLGKARRDVTACSGWQTHAYQLTPIEAPALLFYVRGGINGFYCFQRFQRYWRRWCTAGVAISLIDGSSHGSPSWAEVARIIAIHLRRLGYLDAPSPGTATHESSP